MAIVEAALNLPQNLYIEVTNRCNLKCKACILYKGSWEPPRDITLDELIRITDQLPELKQIALHGIGEPLLNEALPVMIRHLKNRDVFVFFNSNGILIDERRQYELITAGLDELRISLDAASPQGYKDMRNSDKFDRIVGNLKSFVAHKRRLGVACPKLSLWYLGTRENIAELPEFIRLAAAIGIKDVYLQRLVYFQDDGGYGVALPEKTLMQSDGKTREYLNQSQDLAKQFGIRFSASGLSTPLESVQTYSGNRYPWQKCFRPKTLMYITSNGNVLPCCISPFSTSDYSSIILGNVFESPLKEIWLGSKYTDFRKTHQTDTPPKCCRGCGILWSL
ncbi:MAG: radical SAM protein [Desulfobacterales bacterium]|jgi:radical SAM protein with 4Fe4S-binding SPASM domain|nr:radical SAM protein [Desulfobacterales bacterium]